jgi:hypothetical protein
MEVQRPGVIEVAKEAGRFFSPVLVLLCPFFTGGYAVITELFAT